MSAAKFLLAQECHVAFINSLVQDHQSGALAAYNIFEADTTLNALESAWSKFSESHDKLLNCKDVNAENSYFKDHRHTKTYQHYILVKAALKTRMNELEPRTAPPSPHIVIAAESAHYRTQLPTIQPPKFQGDILEWQSFKHLFLSVINKQGVTNVDKMHFLRQSLQGNAASLIANVEINDTSFDVAWATLTTRYENKRVLITAQLNKLFGMSKMTTRSAKELNAIINTSTEAINSLKALESPVEHWDQLIVHLLVQRLDSQTREDWEINLGSATEYPTLERLKAFLLGRARALENLEERLPAKPQDSKSNKKPAWNNKSITRGAKSTSAHVHAASTTSLSNAPASGQNTQSSKLTSASHSLSKSSGSSASPLLLCSCCGDAHFIVRCPTFMGFSSDERLSTVTSRALCLNCLGPHAAANCRSQKRCRLCQAAHHSMLHDAIQISSAHNSPNSGQHSQFSVTSPSGSGTTA